MELQKHELYHIDILKSNAAECMVLLKSKGDFPISDIGRLALYGSGARKTVKGGTGSGDVNSRFYVTVENGLENAGFQVTTKYWLDEYDNAWKSARKQYVKEIKKKAKEQHTIAFVLGMGSVMPEPEYEIPIRGEGDTAVYVLSRISGEGNDRNAVAGDIKLSKTEIRDILLCQQKYEHFLLVLNVGGVVDLSPVLSVDNILVMSQLGVVTGDALGNVIIGKNYPSGKLTTTWSAWEDYQTIGDFGSSDDIRYREGIYVGYRYFDSVCKKALFPFGYGISYTEFSISHKEARLEQNRLIVRTKVTNTGKQVGKEVIQLYVTAPWGKLDHPYQSLIGFAKTAELAPGQSEEIVITCNLEDLASYDKYMAAYILEQGNYILRVGANSRDTCPCVVLHLKNEIVVRQLEQIGGDVDFEDWKPKCTWEQEDISDIPVIDVDESICKYIIWPKPEQVDPEVQSYVKKLSDEDLSSLCIGSYTKKSGVASVIGAASMEVAGAAGESYKGIPDVPTIIMADGPAGLRLSQKYLKGKNGAQQIIDIPSQMAEFIPGFIKAVINFQVKRQLKGNVQYQYCTAIPIGTAIAQSWNTEFAELCGDIVGKEMEQFEIQLWLAPAFNIHRSPLCGRNFEYYSEDPMISGKVGAAITKGVQKHKGCGTTVKHFYCNNQETKRYQSNSVVGERALREIYLKGFEICIRDSEPCALMTSYNLLNGEHTSERADMIKTVLRKEWGYTGLVMSDWVITSVLDKNAKYRMAKAAASVKGGNDLFMPGNNSDYMDVLTALKGTNPDIRLSREEVEFCAGHVVHMAWKLHKM